MKYLKKFKFTDYIFIIIFVILFLRQLPGLINNYKIEGKSVPDISLNLVNNKTINIQSISGPKILVFWATWCPPCIIEIKRFNKAIKNDELPKEKIFFINLGESLKDITKFIKENKYDLNIVSDQTRKLSKKFNIVSTPTVVHLSQKNIINNISTGISPLGIYRAMWLFYNN